MTSIQFVVHPLPGTQEQLQEKLKEVADRLNKYHSAGENGLTKKHLYRPQTPLRLTTPFSLTLFASKGRIRIIFFLFFHATLDPHPIVRIQNIDAGTGMVIMF